MGVVVGCSLWGLPPLLLLPYVPIYHFFIVPLPPSLPVISFFLSSVSYHYLSFSSSFLNFFSGFSFLTLFSLRFFVSLLCFAVLLLSSSSSHAFLCITSVFFLLFFLHLSCITVFLSPSLSIHFLHSTSAFTSFFLFISPLLHCSSASFLFIASSLFLIFFLPISFYLVSLFLFLPFYFYLVSFFLFILPSFLLHSLSSFCFCFPLVPSFLFLLLHCFSSFSSTLSLPLYNLFNSSSFDLYLFALLTWLGPLHFYVTALVQQ